MFPWENAPTHSRGRAIGHENVNASNVRSPQNEYAAALKAQVDQRAHAKAEAKRAQAEAERLDDLRIERESAQHRAEVNREIQAQRDREALVRQREAEALARYNQAAQPTREQKVEAYQMQLEAQAAQQDPMGRPAGQRMAVRNEYTGISEHPSTRVHAAPGGHSSFSFSDGSAPEPQHQRAAPRPAPEQPPARQQMSLPPRQQEQMVAGQRMPVRTEYTGISEHPSTRVHAAPGGHSSFSFSDGSAPEPKHQRAAPRAAPEPQYQQPQYQQQQSLSPLAQQESDNRAAANAIRERARGGRSLW